MKSPPRHPKRDRMVNGFVLMYSYGYIGILQSIVCWSLFFCMPSMIHLWKEDKHPSEYSTSDVEADYAGMTMYYWTLVLGQIGAAVATTTTKQSIFHYGLPNKWLNGCFAFEIILALLVIFCTPLQNVFKTRDLNFGQVLMASMAFVVIVMIEELRKWSVRNS